MEAIEMNVCELIKLGENERIEFKENIDVKRILETVSAFANTYGGLIILGVNYKNELKRSITVNDAPRAAFYAGKLMLMFLKMGNLKEAYKYASDLKFYARGELTGDVEALAEQIKVRLEEGLSFAGEELLAKAEIIAHKVSLGFEKL